MALIPNRLPMVARHAGMALDVVPGLVGLAAEYNLDFMDGMGAVVDTVPGPVNGRTEAFGVQSEPPLVLADWAVRWVTDQLRGLVTAEKEDPLTLDKYVCKH